MEKERNFDLLVNNQEETINIRQELEKYLPYWKLFVLSGVAAVTLAFIYLRYSTATYSASATILIKDNKNAGISTELAAFEDLGIIGGMSANNPENEVEIIKSRKIVGYVIDSLDLQYTYYRQGRVKATEMYEDTPVKILVDSKENWFDIDTTFSIKVLDTKRFDLFDGDQEMKGSYNFSEKITNEWGFFSIEKTVLFEEHDFEQSNKFLISINSRNQKIDGYLKNMEVAPIDKNSSVLKLNLTSSVIKKAEDIINEMINQYNYDAVEDQNQVSIKTKIFIDERLLKIGEDLSRIQDAATAYKDKNKITGLIVEGELALKSLVLNNEGLLQVNTELSLATWIQERLKKSEIDFLPENLGFKDVKIAQSISEFNKLVSQRNRLAVNAGKNNPNLRQANMEIASYKQSLELSIENLIYSLKNQLKSLNKQGTEFNNKVNTMPAIERGFIDIARQQEIVSELYSYLLKKKEETAISLAVTVPKAKIVDVAYASEKPISPKKRIIYLASLLLGVMLPFGFIYIKNLLDTKVHSRKDIEQLTSIPFIGDVPHSETDSKVVIGNDSRTSTAEAFRLIRTNLDFMLSSKTDGLGQTVFVTSTTSGEGKSFISINLAAALSLSNKKVLLMGLDLRAPKVTEYLGIAERKGITNYITNDKYFY